MSDAPSKQQAAEILTAETIPSYLQEQCWDDLHDKVPALQSLRPTDLPSALTVTPIAGGNVNYAFCLTFATPNHKTTVFLKQAPEFVAIFGPDGFPLTSQRMQREINVYHEWSTLLGTTLAARYLPQIYHFDRSHMAVVMEFLEGFELLDHVLVQDPSTTTSTSSLDFHESVASSLGDFMGRTHALTHASYISTDRRLAYTSNYENREMRDIQLEFVFTKCYQEATDEQRAGLELTPEFLAQVKLLRDQYNGQRDAENFVLNHGDLHPGSVMVHPTTGHAKVIDPEFTVYGPPGLDVGSLLSGYILGAIHQAHAGHIAAAQELVQASQAIWKHYLAALQAVWSSSSNNNKPSLDDVMQRIAIESVGFAAAEVCRTALEFAGGRKWLQFDDPTVKAAAKKNALTLVQQCMVDRHAGGMDLLWTEMTKAIERVG